jgi:hypothetical protein
MTVNHDDPLTQLEAALDVTPSRGFEAEVRRRVSQERFETPVRLWLTGAAVVTTLALVIAFTWTRQAPQPVVATISPVQPSEPAGVSSTPRFEPAATVKVVADRPADVRRRREPPALQPTLLPEVIVPSDQAQRLEQLAIEVGAGRVTIGPQLPGPPREVQVVALTRTDPVLISPIRLEPLANDGSAELRR